MTPAALEYDRPVDAEALQWLACYWLKKLAQGTDIYCPHATDGNASEFAFPFLQLEHEENNKEPFGTDCGFAIGFNFAMRIAAALTSHPLTDPTPALSDAVDKAREQLQVYRDE